MIVEIGIRMKLKI